MTLNHLWHRPDFINRLNLRHFNQILSNGDDVFDRRHLDGPLHFL